MERVPRGGAEFPGNWHLETGNCPWPIRLTSYWLRIGGEADEVTRRGVVCAFGRRWLGCRRGLGVDEAFRLGEELLWGERFREEEGSAGAFGILLGQVVTPAGQQDDRNGGGLRGLLEEAQGAEAVEFRHEDVHDDERRLFAFSQFDRFETVASDDEFVAAAAEGELRDLQHVRFVVDDQDLGCAHGK